MDEDDPFRNLIIDALVIGVTHGGCSAITSSSTSAIAK
jgi:hypothetical protein